MPLPLAALLALSAAGPASAATISLDRGYLKLTNMAQPIPVVAPGAPVELTNVTYSDGGSGDFSLAPGDFAFPPYSGSVDAGISLDLTLTPLQTLTGSLDPDGDLRLSAADYTLTVALGPPVDESCTVTPIPLALSTADNATFRGNRFDPGSFDGPTGGALSGAWATLPLATPVEACAFMNGLAVGPGGLWLSEGVSAPTLTPKPAPPDAQPPVKGDGKGKGEGKKKCGKPKRKGKRKHKGKRGGKGKRSASAAQGKKKRKGCGKRRK